MEENRADEVLQEIYLRITVPKQDVNYDYVVKGKKKILLGKGTLQLIIIFQSRFRLRLQSFL